MHLSPCTSSPPSNSPCRAANAAIAAEPVATNITVRGVAFSDGRGGLAPADDRIVIHRWNARPVGIGGKRPLTFEDIKAAVGSTLKDREIRSIIARRKLLLDEIGLMIKEQGEDKVLY